MTFTQAIGVIGGYGAVGSAVVRRLHRAGVGPLLVAGRDPARADTLVEEVRATGKGHGIEAATVDLTDLGSLDAFAARCRLVVNCAGPSYRVLDAVAGAALRRGADYVDAAGDDPAHARLHADGGERRWTDAGRTAVFSAGALPGLSGLLPRALIAGAAEPARLDAYLGGVAPLTPAAAGDVLLGRGPEHGTSAAAWENGRIRKRALEPRRGVRLDAFPKPVDAYPFLATEAARLAAATGIGQVRWYTVFGGTRFPEELTMAWAMDSDDTADLVAAAEEDVKRLGAWYGQEFHVWERTGDGPPDRSLVLRAPDSYELSAFLTALASRQVLAGSVPPGVHFAADVLDPARTVESLASDPAAELEIR
ncbi:saccharopine dehydrogenase NADP-binding domain-containing protein [Streptomyces sp. NPDC014623]|uniref:saccharopine dehydrogenase NADP-binding domain-containing protein n=1 Tax=Streptomyces sp. NPDC014623 TaxID=3364875 RepID=UPI0036FC7DAC